MLSLFSSMHQVAVLTILQKEEWLLCQRTLAGIILPFNTFGSHLDAANKTIDINLEIKNFGAAGKIIAEIWSESIIDNPVVASYTSPPEKKPDEVVFQMSEEWKAQHVRQSEYMLRIIKCSDSSGCKPGRTNYPMFFFQVIFTSSCGDLKIGIMA